MAHNEWHLVKKKQFYFLYGHNFMLHSSFHKSLHRKLVVVFENLVSFKRWYCMTEAGRVQDWQSAQDQLQHIFASFKLNKIGKKASSSHEKPFWNQFDPNWRTLIWFGERHLLLVKSCIVSHPGNSLVAEFPLHRPETQPKVFTCAAAVFNWFCQTEDSSGQTGGWTPRLYLCRAYGLRSKRAGLSSVQIRNLLGSAHGCTKIAQISPIPKSKQAGLSSVRIGNLLNSALGWTKISDHFDLLVYFESIISNTYHKKQAVSTVHCPVSTTGRASKVENISTFTLLIPTWDRSWSPSRTSPQRRAVSSLSSSFVSASGLSSK